MVLEAINAVSKFIASQNTLVLAALPGGAKVSSATPAIPRRFWSASSLITSTTSSTVILPISWLLSLTTGEEIRSFRSKIVATSLSSWSTYNGEISVSIISLTVIDGIAVIILLIDNSPKYSLSSFTTKILSVFSGSSPWSLRYLITTSIEFFGRTLITSVFKSPPAVLSG